MKTCKGCNLETSKMWCSSSCRKRFEYKNDPISRQKTINRSKDRVLEERFKRKKQEQLRLIEEAGKMNNISEEVMALYKLIMK